MPLYELICLAHHYPGQYIPLRKLLQSTATFIHKEGGCVRRLDNFGNKPLPKRLRRDGAWHDTADYWTMHFDTNPVVLGQLHERLRSDPRILRWSTLKRGVTLPEVTSSESLSQTIEYPRKSLLDVEAMRKQHEAAMAKAQQKQQKQEPLHASRATREAQQESQQ